MLLSNARASSTHVVLLHSNKYLLGPKHARRSGPRTDSVSLIKAILIILPAALQSQAAALMPQDGLMTLLEHKTFLTEAGGCTKLHRCHKFLHGDCAAVHAC